MVQPSWRLCIEFVLKAACGIAPRGNIFDSARIFMKGSYLALLVIALLGTSLSLVDAPARGSAKKATPPKPEELAGVWIGFWEDEEFTRLDLRADGTGYCAYVAPPDFITHQDGVQVYRVTRWMLDGRRFNVSLTPVDSREESIYLRGIVGNESLRLEVGGVDRKWREQLVL